MKRKYLYIDFEYCKSKNAKLELVCCVLFDGQDYKRYWLYGESLGELERDLALYMLMDYEFVSFAVQAEARSFLATKLNPLDVKWIDLMLEYRCLLNHNHSLAYGWQLINGKPKHTKPPINKYLLSEEEKRKQDNSKPEYNLAAACYKLLKIDIDSMHKNNMRNLIISAPKNFSYSDQIAILEYCQDDVKHLPDLHKAILNEYIKLLPKEELYLLKDEMHLRANFAVHTAMMEQYGYPIDIEATRNFSSSVKLIIDEVCRDINKQFPEMQVFESDLKTKSFVRKEAKIRKWIDENKFDNWLQTSGKKNSLALEAFTKHFNYSHEYPRNNFGAQMVRYLKLKQSLNGFMPVKLGQKRKSFWESVGDDNRVRPYLGIYGSQSARSQPSATGFIPLKAAWMRALIMPDKDKILCGIDYGSQEFLLAALLSKDENMIDAYLSGDPYLYLAKLAGAVPKDGARKDFETERNMFKSTTLGLSYGMTSTGLSVKLSNDLGRKVSKEEAQDLIDIFYENYSTYEEWQDETFRKYQEQGYLKLPCGWYMFGDNDNSRSVLNFPVQGIASSILRKAVELAMEQAKLKVIYTLHDAIYIETDHLIDCDILRLCMYDAFQFYIEDDMKSKAEIRLDMNAWGNRFKESKMIKTPTGNDIFVQPKYIDKRSKSEYEKFKKYFYVDPKWIELQ